MSYDGKIVSINLGTTFYYVRYTSSAEEDMTVSDVQRFWIANKKKRGSKK